MPPNPRETRKGAVSSDTKNVPRNPNAREESVMPAWQAAK